MIKVFYPYQFQRQTWSIVTVLSSIARRLGSDFTVVARDSFDGQVKPLSWYGVIFARYDILHIHAPTYFSCICVILARLFGKRVLFTVATPPSREAKYFLRMRLCIQLASEVVAITDEVRKKIHSTIPSTTRRSQEVQIITNGVDYDFFDPAIISTHSELEELLPASKYAVFIGEICEGKNPDLVFELARRLPEEHFVMIGKVAANSLFSKQLADTGNITHIEQLDRVGIRYALHRSGVLLFPSHHEGFGLVAVEAMAMCTPVICQPVSALPEVIGDAAQCRLIDGKDVEGWMSALRELQQNKSPELRVYAKSRFDWGKIASDYEQLYSQLEA